MRSAKKLLKREEGYVPHAYKDHLGYWTIGYGRLIDERKGGGISREEGEFLLTNDIRKIEDALDEAVPWWREMTSARQAVLLSMAYQMGIRGVLGFRNTLRHMEAGDYDRAARGMMASKWARYDTPGRAARHAEIMVIGRFP
jgi:lysozyme